MTLLTSLNDFGQSSHNITIRHLENIANVKKTFKSHFCIIEAALKYYKFIYLSANQALTAVCVQGFVQSPNP